MVACRSDPHRQGARVGLVCNKRNRFMFGVDYPRDHVICRGSERAAVVMRRMWIALLVFAVPMSACMARAGVIEIERIAVTVSDLGRTEAFYRDGLGFRTLARQS